MLTYGSSLIPIKSLPELQKPKKPKNVKSWWFYLIDFIADLLIEAVAFAVNIISAGQGGRVVSLVLGAVKDFALPLLFGYKVNWVDLSINAGINLAYLGISKIITKGKKVLRHFKNVVRFIQNPQAFLNFAVNKSTYQLRKILQKKFDKIATKKIIKAIRKGIKVLVKAFAFYQGYKNADDKQGYVLKNVQRYATSKLKFFLKKMTRKGVAFLSKNKIKNNGTWKDSKTWISFTTSKWIDGVKIASNTWLEQDEAKSVSFYVFFNREATHNKKTLLFIDRPKDELISFLNATSKGKYYLDTWAWGWEVGKKIRTILTTKKEKFWINKLENSIYNEHFKTTLKSFDSASEKAIEEFRNSFKVLSSTRRRNLGNKIVVEFASGQTKFYNRIKTVDLFNNKFGDKFKDFKRVNFGTTKLVKKPIKL